MEADRGLPNSTLQIDAGRFEDRQGLLRQVDGLRERLGGSKPMDDLNDFQREAYEVLTTGRARKAFDLESEPLKIRERYGPAKEMLLARRLVEAGVSFVNVYVQGRPPGSASPSFNWDDHAVNWDMPSAMKARLPFYDHAVATLIEDIHERGLDERVLVIVSGEFGRTPRLEYKDGKVGRDHWPRAMSILLSGGGISRGNVIGATDSQGGQPKTVRYDPHDFLATVYDYLGIDPYQEILDRSSRPVPLTRGVPIPGMV